MHYVIINKLKKLVLSIRNGHPKQLVLLLVDGILDLCAHVLDADARYDG